MLDFRKLPLKRRTRNRYSNRVLSHGSFSKKTRLRGRKGEHKRYRIYIYIVYSPRYVASILGPKSRGGGSEDISRCRPTYHSFAARPTPRSIHKLRSAKVNGGVGRYGAIALHKTSLARQVGEVDGSPHPVVCARPRDIPT